jgi:ketosteroid isomerase-like protein
MLTLSQLYKEQPMMKRFSLITLILLVASSIFATVNGPRKADTNVLQDKASLEQTVNQFLDAIKAGNVEKLKPFYTPDYTFTGPDGKMMSADERLKMVSAGTAGTVQSFSDVSVRTYGPTGLATGVAMNKMGDATTQTRFLQVWTWQGGHWRLAASQVTPISS